MPFALLKYALAKEHPDDPHFRWSPELKSSYDVIVIGAGGHGLAIAYYLATQHGIKNVCVLDKGWLAGGNTARNTTIIRANYLTPEGVLFYKESVDLWRGLSNDLDINMMYSERGHFTLAHTDAAMRTARWRAEVNKHLGVSSEVIGAGRGQAAVPDHQHRPTTCAIRSSARSIIRRAPSRATTPSPGATPRRRSSAASKCTRRPASTGS